MIYLLLQQYKKKSIQTFYFGLCFTMTLLEEVIVDQIDNYKVRDVLHDLVRSSVNIRTLIFSSIVFPFGFVSIYNLLC